MCVYVHGINLNTIHVFISYIYIFFLWWLPVKLDDDCSRTAQNPAAFCTRILSVDEDADLVTWLLLTDFSNFFFFFFFLLKRFPRWVTDRMSALTVALLTAQLSPPRSAVVLELRPEVHLPAAQPRSSPALLIIPRAVPLLFYSCRPWVSLSSIIGTCLCCASGCSRAFIYVPRPLW